MKGEKVFKLKKEYIGYENKSLRLLKDLIEKVQEIAKENEMSTVSTESRLFPHSYGLRRAYPQF